MQSRALALINPNTISAALSLDYANPALYRTAVARCTDYASRYPRPDEVAAAAAAIVAALIPDRYRLGYPREYGYDATPRSTQHRNAIASGAARDAAEYAAAAIAQDYADTTPADMTDAATLAAVEDALADVTHPAASSLPTYSPNPERGTHYTPRDYVAGALARVTRDTHRDALTEACRAYLALGRQTGYAKRHGHKDRDTDVAVLANGVTLSGAAAHLTGHPTRTAKGKAMQRAAQAALAEVKAQAEAIKRDPEHVTPPTGRADRWTRRTAALADYLALTDYLDKGTRGTNGSQRKHREPAADRYRPDVHQAPAQPIRQEATRTYRATWQPGGPALPIPADRLAHLADQAQRTAATAAAIKATRKARETQHRTQADRDAEAAHLATLAHLPEIHAEDWLSRYQGPQPEQITEGRAAHLAHGGAITVRTVTGWTPASTHRQESNRHQEPHTASLVLAERRYGYDRSYDTLAIVTPTGRTLHRLDPQEYDTAEAMSALRHLVTGTMTTEKPDAQEPTALDVAAHWHTNQVHDETGALDLAATYAAAAHAAAKAARKAENLAARPPATVKKPSRRSKNRTGAYGSVQPATWTDGVSAAMSSPTH